MINFTVITSFTDELFEFLYDGCSEEMDAGSYPWHLFPVTTREEKIQHLKTAFNAAPFKFTVDEDGHFLMLNAGVITDGVFTWRLGLIGPDLTGSKSWLYRDDYSTARNNFWPANNITAFRIETLGKGTSMHDHVISIKTQKNPPGVFSSVEEDFGVIKETFLEFDGL
jgi:hypothetical protein